MKKIISLSPAKSGFGPLLFSGNLGLGLQKAGELGYDGVELSLRDSKEIDLWWLQAQLNRFNLRVYGIATGQTYYNDGCGLFSSERRKRKQAIQRMKGHIDLAAKLEAMVIIGGIRGRLEDDSDHARQLIAGKEAIYEVGLYGREKGVTLLLEPINHFETNVINTLAQGVELIEELALSNLKLLADTYHMNLEEVSCEKALKDSSKYLAYIHFADSNRLAPGWGHTDFQSIFRTLMEIGFGGPIGIEVLPQPDDLMAARQGIEFLNNLF